VKKKGDLYMHNMDFVVIDKENEKNKRIVIEYGCKSADGKSLCRMHAYEMILKKGKGQKI